MRRITAFLLALAMTLTIPSFETSAASSAPSVSADSAILMDAKTGEILYSKNIDAAYPPASTTKVMTALLTLENCKLDDVVTVGKKPPMADGSKIYIFEGEKLTVKDLLYGLLLSSANDCAEALAEHMGGSVEGFAEMMNKRAKELGCENTNFVNPSGLYDENHKTSSHDLALILGELSKHKEYPEIATTLAYKIGPTNKSTLERPLWNENKLIQKYSGYYYPYCIGGKTGYTIQSQHSYVSVAEKDGRRLVLALVHDSQKTFFKDAINLFNYGYNGFEKMAVYSKGDVVTTFSSGNTSIPLLASEDLYYYAEKGTDPNIELNLEDLDLCRKIFSEGDELATTEVKANGTVIGSLKLTSGADHSLMNVLSENNYLPAVGVAFSAVLILLVLMAVSAKRRNARRRAKKKTMMKNRVRCNDIKSR
ncbi:MAG: D-alanyl-D-alanine carboxypeptidase [Firmicutes bacterium]|nr:D-alanyl-D-alanine carboxypeptidase [Bacillota bacterium]